jgi:UDP-N-acetylmuramoyl-tripeptide--D-alanyl-D-alanine ligase
LKGERFDGNLFVEEALEKGCNLAVTSRKELKGRDKVLCVEDPLVQLQELAAFHRRYWPGKVLAITGSNGKTTTKELVASILGRRYGVLSTTGNLNNHIGVPLTLLALKDEEVAVVEMGANHPGEIALLASIAAPELGLITNVGKAHLEGFGSVEGVLEAKGELYEYLSGHHGKVIVDGSDNQLLEKAHSTGVQVLEVGPSGDLPVIARITGQDPYLEVEIGIQGRNKRILTRLVGAYNLQNILYSAAVGFQMEVPFGEIAGAIASYEPSNYRSQVVEGGENRVILDSYNANPTSMREAISGLLEYASGPLMLVLGDMAELGEGSQDEHRELAGLIATLDIDRVLLVGPLFSSVCEPSEQIAVFGDMESLKAHLENDPPQGYQILVKGSRVMELERVKPLLISQ